MEIYKGSLQLTVQAKLSAKGFLHFLQRNIFAEWSDFVQSEDKQRARLF